MNSIIDGVTFVKESNRSKHSAIPKIIHLTYRSKKEVPNRVFAKWQELNPGYKIIFYDDIACYIFLLKYFPSKYAYHFLTIPDGAIKADLFRACLLYVYGGIYCDIDLQPYVSLDEVIENDTTFCTCMAIDRKSIFQAFLASPPNNKLMKACVDRFLKIYSEQRYSFWVWSGTSITFQILFEYLGERLQENSICIDGDENIKILDEYIPERARDWRDSRVRFHNVDLFKSRYADYRDWSNNKSKFLESLSLYKLRLKCLWIFCVSLSKKFAR